MEEKIIIGKKDFVPSESNLIPLTAIYISQEQEIFIVPSEIVKQNPLPKKDMLEILKEVVKNYEENI